MIDELLYEIVVQSVEVRKDVPGARTLAIKSYRALGLDFEIRAVPADDSGNSLRSVEFTSDVIGGRNPQTHHSAAYDGPAPGNRITSLNIRDWYRGQFDTCLKMIDRAIKELAERTDQRR